MIRPILPPKLLQPLKSNDRIVVKVMLDLTVYADRFSAADLDALLTLFANLSPAACQQKYKIDELPIWVEFDDAHLTASGRAARAAGVCQPCFEPTRNRARAGRSLEFGIWDGRSIADERGSWSLCGAQRIGPEGESDAYFRLLAPSNSDAAVLLTAAQATVQGIRFRSGHAGLSFAYDPQFKDDAMDIAYALAKRYWGIDIEDLERTLPLMRQHIKGSSWLTLLGREMLLAHGVAESRIRSVTGVQVFAGVEGLVAMAGDVPDCMDRLRCSIDSHPVAALGRVLGHLIVTGHPDFGGQRFQDSGLTSAWIHRFSEPERWT